MKQQEPTEQGGDETRVTDIVGPQGRDGGDDHPVRHAQKPSLRAVAYLRVAGREQDEVEGKVGSPSIAAQREATIRKAESLGAEVVEEFIDRRVSARSTDRPELQRLLRFVAANPVDLMVVQKIDRLSRNPADHAEINRALTNAEVHLVSATEQIDEVPRVRLVQEIMRATAEFYGQEAARRRAPRQPRSNRHAGRIKHGRAIKMTGGGQP